MNAFPTVLPKDWDSVNEGMTLRDWFAGQIINGMFSGNNLASSVDDIAQRAYVYADAMIEARGE